MWLSEVKIEGFRNITHADIALVNGINLLTGSNGSGKSSFLEAIQSLSSSRSFRTNKKVPVINFAYDSFNLYAKLNNNISTRVALSKRRDGTTTSRLNGRNLDSHAEITLNFPLSGITPESGDFFADGIKTRQAYIDWTLFHVEPMFRGLWKTFRRAHLQRNVLLRQGNPYKQLKSWDESYIDISEQLSLFRQLTVERLLPIIHHYLEYFLPNEDLSITYRRGWTTQATLTNVLQDSYPTDLRMGYTHCGPHRADLVVKLDGRNAAELLSRGQRKLLLISLKLAQIREFINNLGRLPIFYIDDVTAELDSVNLNKVLSAIKELQIQTLLTAPDEHEIIKTGVVDRVFHVEQGNIGRA
jgi:DNA replication and repair protein RecF